MLKDSYKLFLQNALRLDGFKPGTKEDYNDIQELANRYCKAERDNNHDEMGKIICALMIRYWYMIPYLKKKSETLKVDSDDIVYWLYLAFMKAFKYKGWLDDSMNVSKESNGAEKCINRCIDSVRQGAFQESNYDSRKINYLAFSLEESTELYGDFAECLFVEENDNANLNVQHIVNSKINKNDLLSAMIIDNICFNDCFTKDKFSTTKLISCLNDDYIKSFAKRYAIPKTTSQDISKIIHLKRNILNRKIKDRLSNLKNDREVLACCMM